MWARLSHQLPLVLGHRGARERAAENTLAAFDLAIDEGADGVELDVRLERTGEVLVLHDRTLCRVTGGTDCRDVETCRFSELVEVDVGGGQRPPSLLAVLRWARRRRARLNIELKADVTHRQRLVDRVVALLATEADASGRTLLSSFHPGMVRLARQRVAAWLPRPVPVALLLHPHLPWVEGRPNWQSLGADGVHPEASLVSPQRFARWKRHRALVNVWTVNDAARIHELAQAGVDAIITDDPHTAVLTLRS